MPYSSPDYDNPWKEILERYFPDFIAFYFPEANREIDWSHGYEFLDKELRQISQKAEIGRRYVDKLVRVSRRSGTVEWILIHVEVQTGRDSRFEERMYVYNNRIYDRYRKRVASFVVLADASELWRPKRFEYEIWSCRVLLEFPSAKLLDWKARLDEPIIRQNVFGVVTAAHLRTLETRNDDAGRLRWKIELVQRLYDAGYTRQQILDLFHFIDWVMKLPPILERSFYTEMEHFEQEKKMRYITSVERIGMERGMRKGMEKGMERGMEKGIEKGLTDAILDALRIRFERVPRNVRQLLRNVQSTGQLKTLHRNALTVDSLAEFVRCLEGMNDDAH